MGNVHWGGVAAVVGMYAVFLVVGRLASRKSRDGTATDLILAGRSLPLWLAVMTMTATWVDGGYLNGTAEAAYSPTKGLAPALQTGFCFGISLILGGLFFARRMRRREFTTLIDPFADRFGEKWSAVLFLPALFGETLWCGALLVAIGSTFEVILHLGQAPSLILAAVVVTLYTMDGGMWSVAWTDALQLLLIPLGLIACLIYLLKSAGGFDAVRETYRQARPGLTRLFPPASPDAHWSAVAIVGYWDSFLVLVLGGIPWNCYFQRVLACRTPGRAASHSVLAGGLTMLLVLPPLLLGVIAVKLFPTGTRPPETLPLLLRDYVPYGVGLLGLAAVVGAVTSSYSSSILSAGSMFAWNVYRPLLAPRVSMTALKLVIRLSIVAVSLAAALLALSVGSVFDLWTFTADLVFVLLFPQLVYALFDSRVNRVGSVTAFGVSLVLRLGGGEPLFGVPSFIDYPSLFPEALVGNREMWYDPESGVLLFPYRTLAALAGLILLPLVSRLSSRWYSPRPLRAVPTHDPTSD